MHAAATAPCAGILWHRLSWKVFHERDNKFACLQPFLLAKNGPAGGSMVSARLNCSSQDQRGSTFHRLLHSRGLIIQGHLRPASNMIHDPTQHMSPALSLMPHQHVSASNMMSCLAQQPRVYFMGSKLTAPSCSQQLLTWCLLCFCNVVSVTSR